MEPIIRRPRKTLGLGVIWTRVINTSEIKIPSGIIIRRSNDGALARCRLISLDTNDYEVLTSSLVSAYADTSSRGPESDIRPTDMLRANGEVPQAQVPEKRDYTRR